MGEDLDREDFDAADYAEFRRRLEVSVDVLREVLARRGFGAGAPSLGAELELALIDERGAALPMNRAVLAETVDPRLTVEIDRFNLECNLTPTRLAGTPFAALRSELRGVLAEVGRAAARHKGRVVPIGILPTLRPSDLAPDAMTDSARYRVLSAAIRRLRGRPFELRIDGADPLRLAADTVTLEGAATSLQIHLRVAPECFAATYNAAQLATGPALALAGNSPTFLGHDLWAETRIALFKQAVDDRTRLHQRLGVPPRVGFGTRWLDASAVELFEAANFHEVLLPVVGAEEPHAALRAGKLPTLSELRLHQGTVWSWNRPVYDTAGGGHLRIELRSLPAGPSISDMLANIAFLVGLTRGLLPSIHACTRAMPFHLAEENFYRAAQHGVRAELWWPQPGAKEEVRRVRADELVCELLPLAREGLDTAGVAPADAEPWLGILAERCKSAQTGAVWQRLARTAYAAGGRSPDDALAAMLERYIELCAHDRPVHTWPLPAGAHA